MTNLYDGGFKSVFREYDIRGRVSSNELNEDSVYRIVEAYARFLQEKNIDRAVLGYDNRECSPGFSGAAASALVSMGIHVIDIGLCVTPTVYYAQYLYKCEGAVMITASHNPNGWSGLKLSKGYSKTLEPDDIRKVFDYTIQPNAKSGAKPIEKSGELLRTHTEANAWPSYIDAIVTRIKMGPYKPRVVLDAGNGGAGLFVYEIFQQLGCVTFQLNCDPDIDYPHYFPNPSDVGSRKRMKEMVTHPYIHADVGLSFDGDGDRLGVVNENGDDIWSDTILAVLSKQLLQKKPNATIVYDVKCSQVVQDIITQNSGVPVMCKTGHSYIKAKMHELGADLAGERSGHFFFGGDDYYGFDDALFAAAKLVEYLSHAGKSISKIIKDLPQYVTSPEIKAHCPDEEKYLVIDEIVNVLKKEYPGKVNDINGARVQFDYGWGLIRASSNLPELVLIFEADTAEHMMQIRSVFRRVTEPYQSIAKEWENDV